MSGDAAPPGRVVTDTATHKVTTLELFFDLVFVYGISQVTAFIAADPTPQGFGQGLLLLALLWWAWVAYSWLGTSLRLSDGWVRLALFAAMGSILVVALSMPYWFDPRSGFSVALLASAAYVAVRILHVILYYLGGRGYPGIQQAVLRLSVTVTIAAVLLVGGAYLGGMAQVVLVAVAVAIDVLGPLIGGGKGWVLAPAHFTERHGLIVIIALGESIVAIGVGAAGLPITAPLLLVAMLGVALACALWIAYFDKNANELEHALLQREGLDQVTTARDVYSYLHFGLVAGLVLMALAVKSALGYTDTYGIGYHLSPYAAVALAVGLALFLATLWAMRRRSRLPTAPLAIVLPLAALALLPIGLVAPIAVTLTLAIGIAAADRF